MDRFFALRDELEQGLVGGEGHSDPALRRAVFDGGEVPEALRNYLAKVRQHAYRVTDEEVEALKRQGYSDDVLYELTLTAAAGESRRQLEAAFAVLEGRTPARAVRS